MELRDWIQVASTLVLGAAAIFGPVIAEQIRRRIMSPRLDVSYEPRVPFYHKAKLRSDQDPTLEEPVHYFRLRLINTGQSQARRCEVVIEELWLYDAANNPVAHRDFSPQNIRVGSSGQTDLNPHRRLYVPMGHVASLAHQLREERGPGFVDVPGQYQIEDIRFVFDMTYYPFSQPTCLVKGTYAIKIAVYSENAPRVERYFRIDWSGKWHDTGEEMLRGLVITPVSRPSS